MQTVISIDIGGTKTKLAHVDQSFNILDQLVIDTQSFHNETSYLKGLFHATSSLISRTGMAEKPVGIGIGAPCGIPNEGIIYQAANLPLSKKVEIVKLFKDAYDCPVYLTKDSYAAALGEGALGAAQAMSNYILLTLGTGLGCGIVINDQLVIGNNGQAGELGHTISVPNGRSCKCGQKGCMETYVSATGIKRTVFQILASSNKDSLFRSISYMDVTAENIFLEAQKGDPIALEAFTLTGKYLGEKLAELVALFEPEAIILAGGLAQAKDFLIEPTIHYMEQQLLDCYRGKVNVLTSTLGNNRAALLGTASLVWQNMKN